MVDTMTLTAFVAEVDAVEKEAREHFPEACVTAMVEATTRGAPFSGRFAILIRFQGWSSGAEPLIRHGDTAQSVLDAARQHIAGLPHRWTPADVAATIGLPICESCDEAVATTHLHDEYEHGKWCRGTENPRVCQPCLESAVERAAEPA